MGCWRPLTPQLLHGARGLQRNANRDRGSFGGVGFEITIRDKVLTVVAPIEDTPAFRAGIQSGDMILRIDGKSTRIFHS